MLGIVTFNDIVEVPVLATKDESTEIIQCRNHITSVSHSKYRQFHLINQRVMFESYDRIRITRGSQTAFAGFERHKPTHSLDINKKIIIDNYAHNLQF